MPTRTKFRFAWTILIVGISHFASTPAQAQIGDLVPGVGPVNRSMGGASVAAPLDAAGAMFWNPATIGALSKSELSFGIEALFPRSTIRSRIGAGALGPGFPPARIGGNTGSNSGVFTLPTIGLVYQPEDSPFTYGLGVYGVAGFGVNYPVDPRNPILTPQPPFGLGAGPLYSNYQVLQIAPTVAVRLDERWSFGFAANVDLGQLSGNPALFARPTPVSGPLGPGLNFPAATASRSRLGGGFQAGVYFDPGENWKFGVSFKSTQWFEPYTYSAINAVGRVTESRFVLDLPMTVAIGTSYTGIDRFLFAMDARFLNYRDTNGFKKSGFDANGTLQGLGWQNVFSLGTGVQYTATELLALRMGYNFSLNPAGGETTTQNLLSPTILQHSLSLGFTFKVTERLSINGSYAHLFQNAIEGRLVNPAIGAIPNTSVRTAATADGILIGASVSF